MLLNKTTRVGELCGNTIQYGVGGEGSPEPVYLSVYQMFKTCDPLHFISYAVSPGWLEIESKWYIP